MTIPLFLLRCVQLGLSMADLELQSIGLINDMYAKSRNDDYNYAQKTARRILIGLRIFFL